MKTRTLDTLFLFAIAVLLIVTWPNLVEGWRLAGVIK